ncbi:T-complex protein 11-like protein 2 [Anopheles ziemanni]|uniref:T-complex protein 11-like protein 2 n=1 Tax=Anopheles coustani TaxID=139045 RepID=UPI00265A116A|nr:T-complex protein 11-like protein 2 [Anopheles coustani]XP_058175684.1 T-complex protein 11-like protein 2 [Anopheles ziemanni]
MPDNTRREPHAAKEEAAAEQKSGQPKDITPLVCSLIDKLTVKADSKLHDVGITLPANGNQPERFVSLNDLLREYKTIEDLQRLHEIAVDDEFKLTQAKSNDPLYEMIAQTMHNAFWDLMREELAQDPPQKERAINLLIDIRKAFRALLEGNNDGALRQVEALLDPAKVHLAIEHDVNAVGLYTKFIIDLMGKACSKARDEMVKELEKKTDLVDRLRGIMELLELMQLDMANFELSEARGEVVKHSIEYERAKFYELLQQSHPISCPATEDWLRRAYRRYMSFNAPLPMRMKKIADANDDDDAAAAAGPSTARQEPALNVMAVMNYAYGELFSPEPEVMIPEVFNLDVERVKRMRSEMLRLAVCAATVYIASQGEVPLPEEQRQQLADQVMILAKDCSTVAAMKEQLESLWVQVRPTLSARVTAEQEVALKAEILKLAGDRSQVYVFLLSKIAYYLATVTDSPDGGAAIPVTFKYYATELAKLGKAYRKLIRHNRAVHGDFYKQIFAKLSKEKN